MSADEVDVGGKRLPVRRTSKQGLRTVTFTMEARQYAAIEQNPEKPSRWGELARSGHQVVQFKDVQTNRFVAVAVDGEAKEYGAGMGQAVPPPTGTSTLPRVSCWRQGCSDDLGNGGVQPQRALGKQSDVPWTAARPRLNREVTMTTAQTPDTHAVLDEGRIGNGTIGI